MPTPPPRWLHWLLPAVFLPVYLAYQNASLWTDEAWVANSILASSIQEMLFYRDWVQSTPPLVLLAMRAAVGVAGLQEYAFRIVPLLAGLGAILLASLLLHRLFPPPLAFLGTAFQGLNYWACKYSQQAKQYSAELLIASAFLYFAWDLMERPGAARFLRLLTFGCIACFAATSTAFWLPAILLLLAVTQSRMKTLIAAAAWTGSFTVHYFVFLVPNRSDRLTREWFPEMLASATPVNGAIALGRNLQSLLLPPIHPITSWLGALLLATALGGLVYAAVQARKDNRAKFVCLAAAVPLSAAITASTLGYFPLLTYPRMILWYLPALTLALCFALNRVPVWHRLSWRPIAGLCLAAALATPFVLARLQTTEEENRPAIAYLKSNLQPGDWIYVTGAFGAQFAIYRRILNWHPGNTYIAAWGWPCCARNIVNQATNPSAGNAAADLAALRLLTRGPVWILGPAGRPGHFGGGIRKNLEGVWSGPGAEGCQTLQSLPFGHTRLDRVVCR